MNQTRYFEVDASADDASVDRLEDQADDLGATAIRFPAPHQDILAVTGDQVAIDTVQAHPLIARPLDLDSRWPLVSRGRFRATAPVRLGDATVGDAAFVVIAGPCSVESRDQISETGRAIAAAGASALRGGAYKPRTSPYEFQGLGAEGVALLHHTGRGLGLPVVTEAMEPADIECMHPFVDMFQVGARNMQNYALLKELGAQDRPVLLKRGPGSNLREWLLAAEYIVYGGNHRVVLCERGIRSFETANRYTLDLATAVLAKQESYLPVIIDPSHATGRPSLIPSMTYAALAAGLDGAIVEVHPRPHEALSDGAQALLPHDFAAMMDRLRSIGPVFGRTVAPGRPQTQAPEVHK